VPADTTIRALNESVLVPYDWALALSVVPRPRAMLRLPWAAVAPMLTSWSWSASPACLRRRDRSPVMSQAPPPNPIAAEPGDGRVLSRPSSRVHKPGSLTEAVALRPQTVLTGLGSHRYSYGGFGGGHLHFHPNTADLRITSMSRALLAEFKARASFGFTGCCWW
jgi:hypothetical protein